MTYDNYLFVFILAIIALTVYGIATNKTTSHERDEMLNDKEMWP